MNLSAENIVKIRDLVRSGYPLKTRDAKDLQGHNDHLVELLEARGRLMLGVEIERDQLKAENDALRRERDARHPLKPLHEPAIGFTGCVICGVYTDHGGLPCPKTRAAAIALSMENQRLTPVEPLRVSHPLDAALGQGEQS